MKWLKRVFDFYLDASIHVAFGVLAMMMVSSLILNISFDWNLASFLFFGTIVGYNFVKYGVEAKKYLLVANSYYKNIQLFSFAAFFIAIYHAWFLNFEAWKCISVLVLLTTLYAIPVLPKARNLRSLGGLKIVVVAVVWAGATVHLPVLAASGELSWDVWVEGVQRFLFVLVLMIPFEIRDLDYDEPDLRTLPQLIGFFRTKMIGTFGAFLFFWLLFLKDHISNLDALSKGVGLFMLGLLMLLTQRRQSTYFSSFWVEALPIFWYIFLLMFSFWI
ncbi:hypothetical protein OO009_11730 [Flavobacteriaceae bacterium KMM 6897]|nr:hypothetical protein [Flavobacteriaceae bacterium KMM 6897]MEB8344996.1 hypothetical protein [Flavobacteriaceae bacterium KMM 6898]